MSHGVFFPARPSRWYPSPVNECGVCAADRSIGPYTGLFIRAQPSVWQWLLHCWQRAGPTPGDAPGDVDVTHRTVTVACWVQWRVLIAVVQLEIKGLGVTFTAREPAATATHTCVSVYTHCYTPGRVNTLHSGGETFDVLIIQSDFCASCLVGVCLQAVFIP